MKMKEQNITNLSDTLFARFKQLLDNNRSDDALSIMQEYLTPNNEVEKDNYEWLFINDLTQLQGGN